MERQRKLALRELNTKAWNGEQDVFQVSGALEANLKKNMAFIKRLRTSVNQPTLNTFIQEIRTLSLHKYLSEIISACYEGLCKLKSPADTAAGIEIISALHQRFGHGDFTGYLGWMIGRGLSTPEKSALKALSQDVRDREEKDRLARQRVLLRVATELWLVGVLRSLEDVIRPDEAGRGKDGAKVTDPSAKAKAGPNGVKPETANADPFPLEVLKDLLGHDRDHVNLPLVVLFVKTFAWDILGTRSAAAERKVLAGERTRNKIEETESANSTEEDEIPTEDPPMVNSELRQLFKNILIRYFEDVKTHLLRDQKAITLQRRRNEEAYVRSGEVFEDRQANFDRQVKVQERLVANAQVLADALGVDMPDLKEKDASANASDSAIGLVKTGDYLRGVGDGPGIWEDEDERRFYENLTDLKDRVPGILLEDGKKKKADADEQVGKKKEDKAEGDKAVAASTDGEDQSTAIANKAVGAQVDALLARLPELTGKDAVDQLAIDFAFLNSKASRNRLIKAVQEIPKGRSDLLPLYARLVATLSKYMPDVAQGLVSYLDDEFRSLQRRKTKEFLGQVRTQNVRYLTELTKFGVVPEHVIFHCLKVALDDFSRMNIEIISNLLENGGRYLLRNPETAPRMTSFLETLQRKKGSQHLGQQERMLIENAMYYVNPPARGAIEQKERSPLEMFIRKLIYMDLRFARMNQIIKLVRKLHWEEDEVTSVMHKVFTKPGKIRYTNLHLLCELLFSVRKYHPELVVLVIDDVLESITFGLENNDFIFNQRRMAEVKYLAELYLESLVDSPLIFDMLYRLITYGHESGIPKPDVIVSIDLPDDYFRIRLVCILLETCGTVWNKGPAKKKLEFFLAFFQYYVQTKDPPPLDTVFLIQDTLRDIAPQWNWLDTLEEASKFFGETVKQNYQPNTAEKPSEADEADDDVHKSGSDSDDEDHESRKARDADRISEGEEVAEGESSPAPYSDNSDEEEHIIVTRKEDERDPEADADFDRELSKMMAEGAEARKFERKQIFDVPLPMRRKAAAEGVNSSTDEQQQQEQPGTPTLPEAPLTPSTMKFSLLSKRGNRQLTKQIDLPADSNFAVAMRTKQQAEKEEQQRIKNLVLNYDLTTTDENDGVNGDYSIFSGPNPNKPFHTRSSLYGNKTTSGGGGGSSVKPPLNGVNKTVKPNISSTTQGLDKQPQSPYTTPRLDKAGNNARNQRARKLQLKDVEWYDKTKPPPTAQGEEVETRNDSASPEEAKTQSGYAPISTSTSQQAVPSHPNARRGGNGYFGGRRAMKFIG
ncbi:ARM repeat-containing protein [Tothia fuscella]|uniref:ARM repeat-containing protein n=1 Tax=Tothia fuscella TaxID=1048955 RepID=A0A9P4NQG1_9PEZI|nr:ARM repeat-containing protein [Tothia fuscella]